jgi:hypothetical protein
MILGGAWYCPLFAIDVKGGGKRQLQKSIAINDKLLEILSLMAKDEAKEEEEFSYKKISVWWLCMVECWMSAYDCCRASPTAVRSAGAARKISHRESEFHESREQLQQKPRNRDMRFRDLIAAVKASMRYGPLIFFIGVSGIGISICKEHNATKTPISRYAKS